MGKLGFSLVFAVLFAFLLVPYVVLCQSSDIKHPETRQVLSIVEDASRLVTQKGEAAFPEFKKSGSKWLHGDTYVFVIDTKGNVIVNPHRPEIEGKNQVGLKDAIGKPFIKYFVKEVTEYPEKTQGWSHYVWFKPGHEFASWKTSYMKLVKAPSGKEYIVGSGLYEMKPEKVFVIDVVEKAAEMVKKEGRMAFPLLRDRTGEFNYLSTYVFVIDGSGRDLVNPAFPQHEGKSVLDLKDKNGRFFVRDMMKVLSSTESGWLVYSWPKPRTIEAAKKETYVKKVKSGSNIFYVGSGIYLE
ncbi:MAG: Cache, type 2 domain protein [Deltaproteobacteria bacterium]|nr:Cache, type 2 domain protein [Deltaproteobacteria bacterium]